MAHIFTPALRRPLSKPFAKSGTRTLIQRAIASLRARGTDAHLWLPGVGTLNGLTTGNYLESTGNTLATVDNPTGLVLDALGTVGVNLVEGGSWTFSTGATESPTGVLNFPASGAAARKDSKVSSGKSYAVYFVAVGSGTLNVHIGDPAAGSIDYSVSASGTYSAVLVADAIGTSIQLRSGSSGGFVGTVSNFSVREVSGIHLTQGTTANKPLLRRGLTNLLTYSSDFSNAAWVKNSVTTIANTVTPNTTATSHGVQQAMLTVGVAYTAQCKFKSNGYIGASISNAGSSLLTSTLNMTTGVITSGASITSATAVLQSDGYWLFTCSFVAAYTTLSIFVSSNGTTANNFAGDGVSGINVHSAAIFQGTLTAAQILAAGGIPVTTTAAASNPDAGKYSWSFDGSNDSLSLGSVPFQMGDDHCVIAGARPDGVSRYLFSLNGATSTPLIAINVDSSGLFQTYWRDDAGAVSYLYRSPSKLGVPSVVSIKKVGNDKSLRVDAGASATSQTPLGVTTLGYASLGTYTVGGVASNYWTGNIGPVLAIKGTVTDAELLMYERLVAALTPGAPSF